MAIVVNSNVASLRAQNTLSQTQKNMDTALERLTSGKRINSASDDSAGMTIANKMTAQIKGLNQAVRNANDGISLAQTAEGSLNETTNILQRMRELGVQAANDTNSTADRSAITQEINSLRIEMGRIANNTEFNGKKLLTGGLNATIHVSHEAAAAGASIQISIGNVAMTATGLGVSTIAYMGLSRVFDETFWPVQATPWLSISTAVEVENHVAAAPVFPGRPLPQFERKTLL